MWWWWSAILTNGAVVMPTEAGLMPTKDAVVLPTEDVVVLPTEDAIVLPTEDAVLMPTKDLTLVTSVVMIGGAGHTWRQIFVGIGPPRPFFGFAAGVAGRNSGCRIQHFGAVCPDCWQW